jgi:hypothetical protein
MTANLLDPLIHVPARLRIPATSVSLTPRGRGSPGAYRRSLNDLLADV